MSLRNPFSLSLPQEWGPSGLKKSQEAFSTVHLLPPSSVQCYNQAGEVVWLAIMLALRAIKRAVSAFHRWFMKYSGMTMIIDNVEERRRGRQNEDPPDEDSGSSCDRDSPLHR